MSYLLEMIYNEQDILHSKGSCFDAKYIRLDNALTRIRINALNLALAHWRN